MITRKQADKLAELKKQLKGTLYFFVEFDIKMFGQLTDATKQKLELENIHLPSGLIDRNFEPQNF